MVNSFEAVEKQLVSKGYTVTRVASAVDAATYLDSVIDGKTVGIGGSATVKATQVYERLLKHNTVFWHWEQDANPTRKNAMAAEIYLTSVNALSETGEIVNIDGVGNRVASTLYGHEKVFYLVGKNKLTKTYEEAVWRARNVAAPHRAQQMGMKTPCAKNADQCYDCSSPERVCRRLVTLWTPMMGMAAEVILIDEEMGL